MTLKEAVERLDELDGEDIIYVRRPWHAHAECTVARYESPTTTGRQRDGMDYFIDAGTAREALEVFEGRDTTLDERLRLLTYYAENDAFPDWVYQ